MNFRRASLCALTVTLFLGIMFFLFSFQLPLTAPKLYIGPGYYPRVLSVLLIVASLAGLYTNYRKKENIDMRIDLPNLRYFFLVLAMAVLIAVVWHFTERFYFICIFSTLILLWFLNPDPVSARKVAKTIFIDIVILGTIYLLFSVVLHLDL